MRQAPVLLHALHHTGRDGTRPPDPNGIWMRKISVIVPNHELSLTGEFVFSFGLLGGEAQWRDYCLMAPIMDALAVSVTWGTPRPPSRARG